MNTTKGQSFYDQTGVFEQYVQHRAKSDNPNAVIETPIVRAMVGEVKGKDCLDIGCGYGAMASYLREKEAASYLGIDPSAKMIGAAREKVVQQGLSFIMWLTLQWSSKRFSQAFDPMESLSFR